MSRHVAPQFDFPFQSEPFRLVGDIKTEPKQTEQRQDNTKEFTFETRTNHRENNPGNTVAATERDRDIELPAGVDSGRNEQTVTEGK